MMMFTAFETTGQLPRESEVRRELEVIAAELLPKYDDGYYRRMFGMVAQTRPDGHRSHPADWARAYSIHHVALEQAAYESARGRGFLYNSAQDIVRRAADFTGLSLAGAVIDIIPEFEVFICEHTNRLPLHARLAETPAEVARLRAIAGEVKRATLSVDDILSRVATLDEYALNVLAAARRPKQLCPPADDDDIDFWAAVADWTGDESGVLAVRFAEQDLVADGIRDLHRNGIHPEYALGLTG